MGKKLGKKAKTLCPKCEFHLCLVALQRFSHKISVLIIWICPFHLLLYVADIMLYVHVRYCVFPLLLYIINICLVSKCESRQWWLAKTRMGSMRVQTVVVLKTRMGSMRVQTVVAAKAMQDDDSDGNRWNDGCDQVFFTDTLLVCMIYKLYGRCAFTQSLFLLFPGNYKQSCQKAIGNPRKHLAVSEKTDAAYHRNVERMRLKHSKQRRVRKFEVGETVSVRIPQIDRACTDPQHLPCVVVEKWEKYKLCIVCFVSLVS